MKVIIPTTIDDGSFTRSSTATYFDSTGTLQVASVDVARITYDPLDLTQPPTPLLETTAITNIFSYPRSFDNASWTKSSTTITANTALAPDGTVSMDKMVENATTSAFKVLKAIHVTSGVYTYSVLAKKAERTRVILRIADSSTDTWVVFNLNTGIVDNNTFSGVTATIKNIGNGVYRCSMTKNLDMTGGTGFTEIYTDNQTSGGANFNYTGDGVSGIYLWHAQFELSPSVTSITPDSTTAFTRAADTFTGPLIWSNIVEPDAGYPAWNNSTTYAIDDKVSYGHKLYSSLRASNLNHNPATDTSDPPYWLEAGPTNKYAMFDDVIGTSTIGTGGKIELILSVGAISGIGFIQATNCYKALISITDNGQIVYTAKIDLASGPISDWYKYFTTGFKEKIDYVITDVSKYKNGIVTIVITSTSGQPSIGNLILGETYEVSNTDSGRQIEATTASPTIEIINYSKKTVDEFGRVFVTPRGYAKRMNLKLMLDSATVDEFSTKLADIRDLPCVWVGADNLYTSLIVYGYYKDWSIEIPYKTKSYCTLTIEGLI